MYISNVKVNNTLSPTPLISNIMCLFNTNYFHPPLVSSIYAGKVLFHFPTGTN